MAKKQLSGKSFSDMLSAYSTVKDPECVPTSIDCINDLWGGGAYKGYMYSIWGPAGCGKSTLTLQLVKGFCKKGLKGVICDVEKALNDKQIESFGLQQFIDDGLLFIVTCSNYQEYENIIDTIAEQDDIDFFVTDSETEIEPVASADLKVTDIRPGLKSAQEKHVLSKMKQKFYSKGIISIVLFHARANIVMMGGGNQPDEKQAGGYAALHYPDIITKITAHAKIKNKKDEIIGNEIRIQTTKNKFSRPFRVLVKKLIFGKGIDKRVDLIDTALAYGIITMAGAGFYTVPGMDKTVRGTDALYELPSDVMKAVQASVKEYQEQHRGIQEE